MPSVTIKNNSGQTIAAVVVKLPNNRISFGPIEAGENSVIYRSLEQRDGVYKYAITFNANEELAGECGNVTSGDYFTHFVLSVDATDKVSCSENSDVVQP